MKSLTLQQKLEASLAASKAGAPSLNPVPKPKKEPLEAEVLPDIREVVTSPADRMKIIRLVAESADLAMQEKQIKNARKPITEMLKKIIPDLSSSLKFMADGVRVNMFTINQKRLNQLKLREKGVSQAIIDACTDTVPVTTLKVTPAGESDEE